MEKTRLPLNKAIDKACCDDPLLADKYSDQVEVYRFEIS